MPSLTQEEARERRLITVRQVEVALDLNARTDAEFGSVTSIEFDAEPGSATFLDFKGVRLESLLLNGEPLDPARWSDDRIRLDDLQPHNTVVVDGVMAYSADGEGLHRHLDPADGNSYLYAMSFLDAGPRWFACFDQPDLKAPYRFEIDAPDDWTVHGNGPSEKTGPGHWRIIPPQPLSTYFVTLVAGPYASVYADHDGIRLGLHVRADLAQALHREADDIITVTGQAFDHYHRIFGVRYPFGEYHQAFVPDFNAGAMENPGCVTFRDSFIYRSRATRAERGTRAGVIAHEMAHQWFGDLVTMRWWDDLWLNESFAEYMAHRCCSEATDYPLWTEFGIVRKAWGYAVDQSDATHPVAGNGAADAATALANFDGISYAKGAAVLRQLASYLGDEVFLSGLRQYFDQHRFGNAEFAELLACWARAAGGVDLDRWTKDWLLTAGVDTLAVRDRSDGGQELTRTAPQQHPADRRHAIHVAALGSDGRPVTTAPVVIGDQTVPVQRPAGVVAVVPDAADETWAKIRFTARDWDWIAGHAGRISSADSRVVIWNSLRDQVRDAELDPRAALDMIIGQLPAETDDVVINHLLQFARHALAGAYAPLDERAGRLTRVYDLARTVLEAAEPDSDRRLVAFRTMISGGGDAELLDHWRRGDRLPTGIHLDADLSWAIVTRICSLADRPEVIQQTLQQDRSAAARVHAARARAALPTAEAKAAAYRLLIEPSELSAYELYATAEAMFGWSAEQVALTRPYALRFFDDIAATAQFRSGWVLGRVPSLAFPLAVAEPEVLDRAEALRAAADTPPVIRRVLAEEIDPLRRAVTVLRRFGARSGAETGTPR